MRQAWLRELNMVLWSVHSQVGDRQVCSPSLVAGSLLLGPDLTFTRFNQKSCGVHKGAPETLIQAQPTTHLLGDVGLAVLPL